MFRRLKRRYASIALTTVLMLSWAGAHAMWSRLSDSQLIETSAMIVVGTLIRFESMSSPSNAGARRIGIIEIDTVLKGELGINTIRLDVPRPGEPVSSSDIVHRVGQKGLWFLRLIAAKDDLIFAADHPQRFVPDAQARPRIEALREFLER